MINILETEPTTQSHSGKKNPRNISINNPKTMFLEISFAITSLGTYLSIIEDIKEPRSKKESDNNYIGSANSKEAKFKTVAMANATNPT